MEIKLSLFIATKYFQLSYAVIKVSLLQDIYRKLIYAFKRFFDLLK